MRLNPVHRRHRRLGDGPAARSAALTLIVGAVLALRQTDLKLMLAYTTVASLGLLVHADRLRHADKAVEAAVLYLLAHALFKGALFMVAGVDRPRDRHARHHASSAGCGRAMPLTFAAALLPALSMAGLPLFFGFLAKEEIYAALDFADRGATALTLVAIVGNALMFAVALAVGADAVPRRCP